MIKYNENSIKFYCLIGICQAIDVREEVLQKYAKQQKRNHSEIQNFPQDS